jgi:hypothetical protein
MWISILEIAPSRLIQFTQSVRNLASGNGISLRSDRKWSAWQELDMSQRELIEPHKGDKRFQRRNGDGTFGESDDQSRSLGQDVRQHAGTRKPKGEGDKGD